MLKRVVPLAFRGSAACWWRLQAPFHTWDEFCWRFRGEFLPPGYEYRILRELDLRTQHPNECLLEYVRALEDLYRRASPLTPESDRVARLLRQCHARFMRYLHVRRFSSLEDVAKHARSIQDCLLAAAEYVPPPPCDVSLEPSCAWRGHPDYEPWPSAPAARRPKRYHSRASNRAGYGARGYPVLDDAGYGARGHPFTDGAVYGARGHPVPANASYGAESHPVLDEPTTWSHLLVREEANLDGEPPAAANSGTAADDCAGHHPRGARPADRTLPRLGLLQGPPVLRRPPVAPFCCHPGSAVGASVEGGRLHAGSLSRVPATAAEGSQRRP
ncbi:uncharacterized protein LOC144137955 [Haemaphysalis longicornis]